MATSSMLRSVTVKTRKQCAKLVDALENAEQGRKTDTPMAKAVHEMTPEVMLKLFGKEQK